MHSHRPIRSSSRCAPVPTRMACALAAACAAMAFASVTPYAVAADAGTVAASQRIAFDIAAGPLEQVLPQFAAASGVTISAPPELVKGVRASPVRGVFSVQEGLRQLLEGTGLQAVLHGTGGYVLSKAVEAPQSADEATLPAVTVSTALATTEGTGSYTTRSMNTATRLGLSPRETPQSISVMTRQQMDDQGITTLDDAVQNITGMVMQKGYYAGNSGSFSSRGFPINNLMLDGLPTTMGANGTFNGDNADLTIYDRVEVVRGANGLTSGSGNPAATVNLVRKRPTAERQVSLTASAGSWNNYQLQLDAANALNEAKTLRGRAVVSVQDQDKFYDVAHDRTQQLYGILEADIARNTTLTFGAHYRKFENEGGYQRLPTRANGDQYGLPRSVNLSNAYDYWDQTDKTVFAEVEHRFDSGWKGRFSAVKKWQDIDMMFSSLSGSEGALRQNSQIYLLDNVQSSFDAMLSGPFKLFGRTHEAAIGIGHRKALNDNYGDWGIRAMPLPLDPWNWNPYAASMPGPIDYDRWAIKSTLRESGLYGSARFNLTDPLSLIVGARVSWYDYTNERNGSGYKVTREITPYAGLVYDLDANHSVYASWTEIFQPQSAVDINGNLLKPVTGTNYEAGIKGEYFGGRLNASLAVFQISQANRPMSDRDGPSPCPSTGGTFCTRAAGEVESKGVELEISGELAPGWQATAGYAYVAAKYVRDTNAANVGKLFDPDYPRRQFKASTSYRLPGEYSRWRVGGSVYVQSGIHASDEERIRQGGYSIFGLHAGYQFSDNLNLRMNVNNVFDKTYYQGIGWLNGGNTYGAPRNVQLTLNYKL